MQRQDRVSHYQAQSRTADELAERGDKDGAIRLLKRMGEEAGAAGDNDYGAFFAAEVIGYTEIDYAKSLRLLLETIDETGHTDASKDYFLLRQVGNYNNLKGDEDAAIVWYDKGLAENPKDCDAMRNKGAALFKKGDHDAAIVWFDKALAENPKDSAAMHAKGVALSEKGDHDAAIVWYDKALAENPKDSAAMHAKGVTLSKKGDEDAAIAWFDKALAENPKDWNAMRQMGVSLSEKGDDDAAIGWFDKALAENPKDWNAMRAKGVSLSKKGDLDAAIVWFDKALAENPKDWNAMRQKGVSLSKKGDEDAAIVWFEKALAENPKDWNAMRAKGVSLSEKGDEDAAIVWFDKALAENPKDWNAMRNKGVSLSKKGDEDAAIGWFDKALAENPKDWNAMRNKGVSLSKKGDQDAAIGWFDKALTENPKDSLSHHQAAVAELRRGNHLAALERLGRALRLEPERWLEDFNALCAISKQDPKDAWARLFPDAKFPPGLNGSETARVPASESGRRQPHPPSASKANARLTETQGIQMYINWLRVALKDEAKRYSEEIENGKRVREEFLLGESLLDETRSMFLVLRRWNSYTPAIPSTGGSAASAAEERNVGGGYFFWHQGSGTVIDPGLDFIENFARAGGRLTDIQNVVLTHAHVDHTADFESLRTLFHQRNQEIKKRVGSSKAGTSTVSHSSRIRFYLSNSAFQKFAGMLPLSRTSFTQGVFTLNPGGEFAIGPGLRMRVLPAYHDDVLSRDHSVGLLFTLETAKGRRRVLLSSDTGLYPLDPEADRPKPLPSEPASEISQQYIDAGGEGADLMVLHIGSVKKEELNSTSTEPLEVCYPNHLGIIGVTRTILACKPKVAVVSEFGEEMKGMRVPLMRNIQEKVIDVSMKDKAAKDRPRVVPADPGFVYDIAAGEFVDWAQGVWVPIAEIAFDDSRTPRAIGYFKSGQGNAHLQAANAANNFYSCLTNDPVGHLKRRV